GSMYYADVVSVLTNKTNLDNAIVDAEAKLQTLTKPSHFAKYKMYSKHLAEYISKGETKRTHLLRNAEAISRLLGDENLAEQSRELVQAIDSLISLYALEANGEENLTALSDIIK